MPYFLLQGPVSVLIDTVIRVLNMSTTQNLAVNVFSDHAMLRFTAVEHDRAYGRRTANGTIRIIGLRVIVVSPRSTMPA